MTLFRIYKTSNEYQLEISILMKCTKALHQTCKRLIGGDGECVFRITLQTGAEDQLQTEWISGIRVNTGDWWSKHNFGTARNVANNEAAGDDNKMQVGVVLMTESNKFGLVVV